MKRDSRLDVARGAAILAIVMVHVLRGMHSSGLVDQSTSETFDRVVGLWCLNVFAFVGGALVPHSVAKRGVVPYLRDRVFGIFVIYVVWTLFQGTIQLLAGSAINKPASVAGILTIWHPNSQLWYLPFLIVMTVVFVPMRPWELPRGWWVLAVAAVLSIAFWGSDYGYVGIQGLGLAMFMVGGMVFGADRVQRLLDRFPRPAAAVLSVTVLVFASVSAVLTSATLVTVFGDRRTVFTVAVGVLASVAASAALLLFGQAARTCSVLALCGRRSLDIFLGHITMAAGTRIVLTHLGVASIWVVAMSAFIVGVLGSLLMGNLFRRVGLGWVFDGVGWPARRPVLG